MLQGNKYLSILSTVSGEDLAIGTECSLPDLSMS